MSVSASTLRKLRQELHEICSNMATNGESHDPRAQSVIRDGGQRSLVERLQAVEDQLVRLCEKEATSVERPSLTAPPTTPAVSTVATERQVSNGSALELQEVISTGTGEDERLLVLNVMKQTASEGLGMDVAHVEGHLSIQRILAGGAVERANHESRNRRPAGDVLEAGDVIFRINDAENELAMVAECHSAVELTIHAIRI